MKKSEVDKLNMQKTEGVFTPNYSFSAVTSIENEDEEVIDYEYVDFILNKTAEEVYQEYLNPLPPEPTAEDFNLEMDYRITMLEMLGGI